ncbi:hypothetical protein Gohar_004320 [Gossypium harknessii]|uniref:Uncharacterized protein n=1 Tax=Gossypium harknessii TaxID=34285 RepID=A0A7J9H4S4_9ROSI|nr:hypothetical protein [Gossypium harknessii]
MLWFRIYGKPFLYGEEMRRQHPHTSRLRRLPLNLRAGEATPSSVPMQEPTLMFASPMPTPPTGSLFYQGGSSSQPPIPRREDARCQPRTYRSQSTEGEDEELPRPQPHSEAKPRGNPARNRQPPNVAQILTNIWTD